MHKPHVLESVELLDEVVFAVVDKKASRPSPSTVIRHVYNKVAERESVCAGILVQIIELRLNRPAGGFVDVLGDHAIGAGLRGLAAILGDGDGLADEPDVVAWHACRCEDEPVTGSFGEQAVDFNISLPR